ncbi:uncharacterized protein LOC101864036 isoform X2 [Aplysia californica]|uniref:Uncharacterized protein LOC101864036 isoform X2 n=1 Tax=Aplysia californica TaxID=6500 RepID=A0ABM0K8W3_APLCA|nr:uncharacterized protein LOC101864036 isoform X2 [Aplysia californica]
MAADPKNTHCKWCAAINCTNSKNRRPELAFFRFPKDPERCMQWVINARRKDLERKHPEQLYQTTRLCSEHFEPCWFSTTATRRLQLKKNAIPTKFDTPKPPPKLTPSRPPICKTKEIGFSSALASGITNGADSHFIMSREFPRSGPSSQGVSYEDSEMSSSSIHSSSSSVPRAVHPTTRNFPATSEEGDIIFTHPEDIKPKVECLVGKISVVGEESLSNVREDIEMVDMVEDIQYDIKTSPPREGFSAASGAAESEPGSSSTVSPPHGASGDASSSRPEQFLDVSSLTEEVLLQHRPSDVFCAGVTGLFFKSLPNRMKSLLGARCAHGELPHERVTVLLATNLEGSEKLPLLCVGSPDNGQYLRHVAFGPVDYKSNLKSWITKEMFTHWLWKLDAHFESQGRNVALLVNNYFDTFEGLELRAIHLILLPINESLRSSIQPCDHGIIRQFKLLFRCNLLQQYVAHLEHSRKTTCTTATGTDPPKFEWNFPEALYAMRQSWAQVESSVIWDAFDSAGLSAPQLANQQPQARDAEEYYEKLMTRLNSLLARRIPPVAYLSLDAELAIKRLPSVRRSCIQYFPLPHQSVADPSLADVKKALSVIRRFAERNFSNKSEVRSVYDSVDSLSDLMDNNILREPRQTSIVEYFK